MVITLKPGLSKKVCLKDFVHKFQNFYNKNNSFKGTLTKNIEKLRF